MCGSKPIYDQRHNDEWEGDLAVCEECFNNVYMAESFDADDCPSCKKNPGSYDYWGNGPFECYWCKTRGYYDSENFEAPKSPALKNLSTIAVLALAIFVGKKLKE